MVTDIIGLNIIVQLYKGAEIRLFMLDIIFIIRKQYHFPIIEQLLKVNYGFILVILFLKL